VLKQSLKAGDDPVTAFIASSEAASAGAESTKQMQAKAGRSSYIAPDLVASVPDPGAVAAAAWYRAAAHAVKSKLHASDS
jgi:dihydroxyacetone kinase